LDIQSSYTRNVTFWVQRVVEGRAIAYNYALQVLFFFIFIFQTWRIVAGKLKKLNNFETGLKLSQYFDPSWSRSGPIFVGAVL